MRIPKKATNIIKKVLIILLWLCLWQIVSMAVSEELLLPSPVHTVQRLLEMACTLEFYSTLLSTLIRVTIGTAIGIILGVAIAVLTASVPIIHDILSPVMKVIIAVPVASFIILLILWTGNDTVPSIISMLMVLPIVWSNVETGIKQTDRSLLEMARLYKMSIPKKTVNIYIPSVMPYFVSSLNSSLGLAWKAGIAAEIIAPPLVAIGKQMYLSKQYLETTDLFAWTLTVVLISLCVERITVLLVKKTLGRGVSLGGKT